MLAVFEGAEDGNIQHEARTSRMGAGKVRAVLTACSPIITFPICTLLCTLPFILSPSSLTAVDDTLLILSL